MTVRGEELLFLSECFVTFWLLLWSWNQVKVTVTGMNRQCSAQVIIKQSLKDWAVYNTLRACSAYKNNNNNNNPLIMACKTSSNTDHIMYTFFFVKVEKLQF